MPPKATRLHHHADPNAAVRPPNRREEDTASSDEEEEEEFDMVAVMGDMGAGERRKVLALLGLQEEFMAIRAKYLAKVYALQKRSHDEAADLYKARTDIVNGARDITEEEVAKIPAPSPSAAADDDDDDDEEEEEQEKGVKVVAPSDEDAAAALAKAAENPHGGIPNFWLTALSNSDVIRDMIMERDRPALAHLQDIAISFVDDDPSLGSILTFTFSKNEYFTNEKLTKTYKMETNRFDGEQEVSDVEGCEIAWTSPQNNLTVVVKEKKQRNKKNNQVRVVQREEKCESFFNFFSPPSLPDTDADDDDEENDPDFYDQMLEMDVEAGQELLAEVVPKAAYYYTGKSVDDALRQLLQHLMLQGMDGDEEDDEEDDDDDDDDDDEGAGQGFKAMVSQRGGRGGAGGRGGRGGAGAAPQQQQECKQQ